MSGTHIGTNFYYADISCQLGHVIVLPNYNLARNIKLFHNCKTHQLLYSILPFLVSIFIADVEVDHKKVIAKDVHQKLKMCI